MSALSIQESVRDALAQAFPSVGFTKLWQGTLKNHWMVYGDQTLYAVEFWQLQDQENTWCIEVGYAKLEEGGLFWKSTSLAKLSDSNNPSIYFPSLVWGEGLPESEWVESTPESQTVWAEMIQVTLSSIQSF